MSSTTRSLTGLFTRLSLSTQAATSTSTTTTTTTTTTIIQSARTILPVSKRHLSTTPALSAGKPAKSKGGSSKSKKKKKGGEERDPRILNLKSSISRAVPSPLRFGRNRYLRHWTIHRAWLLWQRQQREGKERELERMYNSMHSACEELRNTAGPGLRDVGHLYRMAMGKQGIYGKSAIPIEYARLQTETPAREPWNHDWKR